MTRSRIAPVQRTPAGIFGRMILPALALAGCGSDPDRPIGPDPGPGDSTEVALVFADPALQSAVDQAAAESGDAAGLVSLTAKERGIADLAGIEQLTRLEVLDLYGNEIRDLSPLAELTRLRYLDLGSNRVEEVMPLASVKSLRVLLLADNAVTDVSALAGLDSLQSVDLTGNPLSASAAGAQVAALRERGVEVDFGAPDEPGDGGVVLGDLPIVFTSSRRTGEDWDPEIHSLDPKTGVVVNLSEGLATAPFSDGSQPDTTSDWRFLDERIVLVRWGDEPAQSPDGTRIAFRSSRDFNSEVYLMDADGGGPQNLTLNEAWDGEPAWSPDGQRIAFTSDRNGDVEEFGGRFNTDIFVMNADGSGVEQVTSSPLSLSADQPAWSPDGSSIAFARDGGISVLELSSGEAQSLTDEGWGPSWSPDGRWIAFGRTVEYEESHVWRIPAAGGEATQLTLDRFFRTSPTWSPDGTRIAFAREDREGGGGHDLYVIPADGGAGEPITDDPGVDRDPCWAPF